MVFSTPSPAPPPKPPPPTASIYYRRGRERRGDEEEISSSSSILTLDDDLVEAERKAAAATAEALSSKDPGAWVEVSWDLVPYQSFQERRDLAQRREDAAAAAAEAEAKKAAEAKALAALKAAENTPLTSFTKTTTAFGLEFKYDIFAKDEETKQAHVKLKKEAEAATEAAKEAAEAAEAAAAVLAASLNTGNEDSSGSEASPSSSSSSSPALSSPRRSSKHRGSSSSSSSSSGSSSISISDKSVPPANTRAPDGTVAVKRRMGTGPQWPSYADYNVRFEAWAETDPFGSRYRWIPGTTHHFRGLHGDPSDAFRSAIWTAFAVYTHPTTVQTPFIDNVLIDQGCDCLGRATAAAAAAKDINRRRRKSRKFSRRIESAEELATVRRAKETLRLHSLATVSNRSHDLAAAAAAAVLGATVAAEVGDETCLLNGHALGWAHPWRRHGRGGERCGIHRREFWSEGGGKDCWGGVC